MGIGRALLLALPFWLCTFALAPALADPACKPWPGEISPLPTVDDPDLVSARWAKLRADELAQLAAPLETIATVDAQRLWLHVRCLDPESPEAQGGIQRTRPSRIHRLAAFRGSPGPTSPAPNLASALATIGRPLALATARASLAPAVAAAQGDLPRPSAASFEAADRALAQADTLNRQARFEDALASAEQARAALPIGWSPDVKRRRARIEAAAATAQVALGREQEARRRFGQALQADPAFRLDARVTSPKVMRALDSARRDVLADGPVGER